MLAWLNGMIDLPWWGYVAVLLGLTHVTIVAVTVYLHRCQAHRALELGAIPSHFFRFWLWMTTGMVTKQWAAIHRKHHAFCEREGDPHSPQLLGIRKVLLEGAELYRAEADNQETMEKFGRGTPDDWMERHVYTPHNTLGVRIMLLINLILFGVNGLWIWALQMIWIPVMAAGVINGIGHYFGYRNFESEDASTNIFPWGILIGGEELHNNHHTFGTSAKLSHKWWELDLGWGYIRTFEMLGMAKVHRVAPQMKIDESKAALDVETLQAIIANRYAVAAEYTSMMRKTVAQELATLRDRMPELSQRAILARWMKHDAENKPCNAILALITAESSTLDNVYRMRQELAALWERSTLSRDQLLAHLNEWCGKAEASGVEALQKFAMTLRRVQVA